MSARPPRGTRPRSTYVPTAEDSAAGVEANHTWRSAALANAGEQSADLSSDASDSAFNSYADGQLITRRNKRPRGEIDQAKALEQSMAYAQIIARHGMMIGIHTIGKIAAGRVKQPAATQKVRLEAAVKAVELGGFVSAHFASSKPIGEMTQRELAEAARATAALVTAFERDQGADQADAGAGAGAERVLPAYHDATAPHESPDSVSGGRRELALTHAPGAMLSAVLQVRAHSEKESDPPPPSGDT